MSKEILRVTLSAKQVREACEDYVSRRMIPGGRGANLAAGYEGEPIEVVVSEKRVRKAKASPA